MKHYVIAAVLGGMALVSLPAQAEDLEHVAKLIKTKRCPNCDLQGADLAGLNLRGADLQGADLRSANLNLVNLTKADLSGANLTRASLIFTDFTDANLTETKLVGAYFQGGDRLGPAGPFPGAMLPSGQEAYSPLPPDAQEKVDGDEPLEADDSGLDEETVIEDVIP